MRGAERRGAGLETGVPRACETDGVVFRRAALLVLVGGLLVARAAAGAQPGAGDAAAAIAAAEAVGAQFLFDYDFEDALGTYRELGERFPEHPSGPYNAAVTVWTRLAQRSNAVRGPSLRNDRFFSQDGRPEPAPGEEAAFREHLEEAYRRAEALLARDPDHPEGLYHLGAAEGLEAGWAVVVDRAWFRATRLIRRAVGRHRRLRERDPGFRDAYVIPGTYVYSIARLPRALRMIAFLFGMRGDLEGGLAEIRITGDEGRRARWGSLWTYELLMQREGREEEALEAVRRLRGRFPKNPDFALDEITVLTALGRFEAAVGRGEAVLARREAGFGNYHLLLPGLAEAGLGEALLFGERWAEAEAVLDRGLAAGPSPEVRANLLLRRANARDGAGRRPEALYDYGEVIRLDADDILKDWATALRQAPWPHAAPPGSHPTR